MLNTLFFKEDGLLFKSVQQLQGPVFRFKHQSRVRPECDDYSFASMAYGNFAQASQYLLMTNMDTIKSTTGNYRKGQPGKVVKTVVDFHLDKAKGQI